MRDFFLSLKEKLNKPADHEEDIYSQWEKSGAFSPDQKALDEGKEPFVISGPGEYEVKKVFIKGLQSLSGYGGSERINTVYSIMLEGMNLVFLGALNSKKLNADVKEELGEIDILFLPIGGDGVLDVSDAHALAVDLEPKIVIPMHYGEIEGSGTGKALVKFLKEDGGENGKPIDKLTIKKRDLEGKEGEIVVLKT